MKKLKASLASQHNIFHRAKDISENATFASYEVAHLIAKHGKPFSDGEFVKECLIKVVRSLIPEKMDDIKNMSLSRQTITRRIAELSADIKDQVTEKSKSFNFYSIACAESTDASDTAQLLIFLEVLMTISASQRSCLIFSLTGTITGNDIFKATSDAIDAMGLGWDKLCGVATDGAPAIAGECK